jgi:dUTP pyrophosphatase
MDESIPRIVFHALSDDVTMPARETKESAGYDVRAYLRGRSVQIRRGANGSTEAVRIVAGRLELEPGDTALVPTGFRARVPAGYEAQVRIRSSMAFKRGLTLPNAPGTIDADYPDEWLIMVRNDSRQPVAVEHGERIAQVILSRFEVLDWEVGDVGVSTDRQGGFGSTGES